jgi:type I restriction enzyme, S subunit
MEEVMVEKATEVFPKLRFPQYAGPWKKGPIGKHIEFVSGVALPGNEISEEKGGVAILRGINITEGSVRHSPDIDRYYHGSLDGIDHLLLKEGDLVLGMDGSKVGKNTAVISKEDEGSLLIQRVARIRPTGTASIEFIYHHIFSYRFHDYVDVVNTSSGIPHISGKQIRDFEVAFPTLPEQQKIAAFLGAVDRKIQQLKRKQELLERYKKGVVQQLFSQELRFKRPDGTNYPAWEEKPMSSFLVERNVKAPKSDRYPLMSFVAYKGVTPKVDRYDREFLVNDGTGKLYKQTELGDFIYSSNNLETGSIGLNNLGSASISPVYSIFRMKESCHPRFISEYLVRRSFLDKMVMYRQGVVYGQWRIHESDFLSIQEKMPTLEEQSRIAGFLMALDAKVAGVAQAVAAAEKWKRGLLQQMFV